MPDKPYVQFSPADELRIVLETIAANMAKMRELQSS
jgi:hypothetical protein